MMSNVVTPHRLRSLLTYDAETGAFRWRTTALDVKGRRRRLAGTAAGTLQDTGYIKIAVDGRNYKAHRLAWLYVYCEWPRGRIDHADGNPTNNVITNLRLASNAQNAANSRPRKRDLPKGVRVNKTATRNPTYIAEIKVNYKYTHLGVYVTAAEAHAAYMAAARAHFGEFARGE